MSESAICIFNIPARKVEVAALCEVRDVTSYVLLRRLIVNNEQRP